MITNETKIDLKPVVPVTQSNVPPNNQAQITPAQALARLDAERKAGVSINTNIFVPDYARSSDRLNVAQRRIALCGETGSGKTWTSIKTSPNPIYVDIDKGITDNELVVMGIPTVDIWDDDYCNKILKKNIKCNALLEFLKGDAKKLSIEQTMILDSYSALQDTMHDYFWGVTPVPKGDTEPDGFKFWDKVKDYNTELFTLLGKLQCHVIVIFHLEEVRKKENGLLLNYGPLLAGKTKQYLGRFFTDVIRQKAINKANGEKILVEYKWQVKPDDMFIAKSRVRSDTLHIPADMKKMLEMK